MSKSSLSHTFKISENYNYSRVKDIVREVIISDQIKKLVLSKSMKDGEGCWVDDKGKEAESISINGLGENKGEPLTFRRDSAIEIVSTDGLNYNVAIHSIIALLQADGQVKEAKADNINESEYLVSLLNTNESIKASIIKIAKKLDINIDEIEKVVHIDAEESNEYIDDKYENKVIKDYIASKEMIIKDILDVTKPKDGEDRDREFKRIDAMPEERICLLHEKHYESEVFYNIADDNYSVSSENLESDVSTPSI